MDGVSSAAEMDGVDVLSMAAAAGVSSVDDDDALTSMVVSSPDTFVATMHRKLLHDVEVFSSSDLLRLFFFECIQTAATINVAAAAADTATNEREEFLPEPILLLRIIGWFMTDHG